MHISQHLHLLLLNWPARMLCSSMNVHTILSSNTQPEQPAGLKQSYQANHVADSHVLQNVSAHLHNCLALAVQCRGSLVQQQDFGVLKDSTGDSDALLLASTELHPSLPHLSGRQHPAGRTEQKAYTSNILHKRPVSCSKRAVPRLVTSFGMTTRRHELADMRRPPALPAHAQCSC